MLKQLRSNTNSEAVTIKDLRKAVDSIQKLGQDFRIIQTGTKRVICSVAVELNADHMGVLKFAEENQGMLTHSSIRQTMPQYGDKQRFQRAINTLIMDGLCWEDEQHGAEVAYWFPSLMPRTAESSLSGLDLE